MTARRSAVVSLVLCVAGLSSVGAGADQSVDSASAQDPRAGGTPEVRIVAPIEGTFVTGVTQLRALVEPPHLASSSMFFVDGRQVCLATKLPFECEWDAGSVIAEHHIRLVVNLAAGGRVVRTTRTRGMAFAENVDVDVVQVTVTVKDGRGQYVKGLPQSAFRVSEDGQAQTISHFYSENVPLELVVALDVSGSMRSAMPTLKKAVARFLSAVPSRHRVTLIGFNNDVFTLTRKTTDPEERMRAVDRLTAWGSTVLYEAILSGAEMLGSQMGRKALVVFTDGEDQASHVTIDDVELELQASDLTLYMIGQGRGVTSQPLRQVMERLARPTGGRALVSESIDGLTESFDDLLQELSNQYVLGYQPTNVARDDTWRQITVEVDGHRRVRARQGYRATAPALRNVARVGAQNITGSSPSTTDRACGFHSRLR